MKKFGFLVICALAVGCGDEEAGLPECVEVEASNFAEASGWQANDYAPSTTMLGCYPFHAEANAQFGSFISMRTGEVSDTQVDACETVIETLNCQTYSGEGNELSFFVESEDRLTMRVIGTLGGQDVDNIIYFNPCQPSCLAAITLETIDDNQQKICEIPAQVSQCLFPDTAHSFTFERLDGQSISLRLGGKGYALQQ